MIITEFDEKTTEKEQKTTTGLSCSGGELKLNDFDEALWEDLRKDFDNMLKDTPAITSSFNLLIYPLKSAKLRIDPGSQSETAKEAASYIEWCFKKQWKGFKYNLRHKVLALAFGMIIHEKVIKKGDEYKFLKNGKYKKVLTNRVIKYSPIQNDTINKFHYNEVGDFIGITHEKRVNDPSGSENVSNVELYVGQNGIKKIDDIFSIFTWDELFNDVRGNSMFRPARLYWTCLKKIVISKTINIQRGAGLVGMEYKGTNPSEADKAKMAKLGRSLNQLNGDNYYWTDENVKVILNQVQGQTEVTLFIDFLYKQILLTLLTEFIAIGMGQVGAYNAGETQKSPYEMSINNLLETLKEHYQEEIKYMIDISYLSGLAEEDMPRFEFEAPAQADMLKVSQMILNFKNAGINFTQEEMEVIKRMLPFLPENNVNVNEQKTIDDTAQETKDNVEMKAKIKTPKVRNLKPEILEFESAVFDKISVENHYLTIEEKAANIINASISGILNDLKTQFKKGASRAHIDNWHSRELENKLMELFESGYNKGNADVRLEIKKAKQIKQLKIKNIGLELALNKKDLSKQAKTLSITINGMVNNIKKSVDYSMSKMSTKRLNNQGGIDGFFDNLGNEFKRDRRDLIDDTMAGYTEGRNDTIQEFSTDETELLYSAILDRNLCDHCSQWDGLTFTTKEIESSRNFQFGRSINLDCLGLLGDNDCRCVWIISG